MNETDTNIHIQDIFWYNRIFFGITEASISLGYKHLGVGLLDCMLSVCLIS